MKKKYTAYMKSTMRDWKGNEIVLYEAEWEVDEKELQEFIKQKEGVE